MYKISNKKNLDFIRQYVDQDVKIDVKKQSDPKKLEAFISAVTEAELASVDVLEALNKQYLAPICISTLLEGNNINFSTDGNRVVPESIEIAFDELLLDVGQTEVEYFVSDSGRISFNKKKFAEVVMDLYPLIVDRNDPELLLIYNNKKGYWEEARQPLHRLIIEMAHSAGGNIEDTWTSCLEGSIIDILKRKVALVQSANFNKDHFPLGNLTLDSNTGDLVPHAPSHLATYGSPVNYNEEAAYPSFLTFLGELFDDETTVQFVQEWFGYTLSTSHKANAFVIGIGSGANGKSTLLDLLAQLVGIQNVASMPLSNFNSEFGLEPLIDKKLNLATESDVDAFKTGKLKALTAGEDVSINRKNKQEITTKLATKLVFLMNELPLLSDNSFGFERRLHILPFDKVFLPHEQNKDLPKELTNELEGVLNWSLEGLRRLIGNNYTFTVSKPMQDAKSLYLGVGNPIENFVNECVVSEPANVMPANEVINAYTIWMQKNKYPFKGTNSPQKFWKLFQEAMDVKLIDFSRGKSNGRTVVRDIGLK